MRFDLTDLRLFMNVHQAGTITGGAEATHLTLASASERIRGMEAALGAPLLVRNRKGVQPTAAGRTLLHHARLVLRQMAQLHGELADYGAGVAAHVRILCNTSGAEYLPQVLSAYLVKHPKVSLELQERTSNEIAAALRVDACEIGVLADSADLTGLETFPLHDDPLVLVVGRGHALAGKRQVALNDLLDLPFIGLAEGSALQEHLALHARNAGKQITYRVRLRTLDAVCRLVGEGVGFGIVPRTAARRHARRAGVRAIALDEPWAERTLVIGVRRLDDLTASARRLVDHILTARPNG